MSTKVIRQAIISDYIDRTAQDVINANSGSLVFSSTGDVPEYLYKSIATLLGVSSSVLATRIVEDLGTGQANAEGGIVISSSFVPSYMDESPPRMNDDRAGAETGYLTMKVYVPRRVVSSDTMLNIIYRLAYILDHSWRSKRTSSTALLPPDLTSTADKTILRSDEGGYYKCHFTGLSYKENLSASQNTLLYKVQYVRRVGK